MDSHTVGRVHLGHLVAVQGDRGAAGQKSLLIVEAKDQELGVGAYHLPTGQSQLLSRAGFAQQDQIGAVYQPGGAVGACVDGFHGQLRSSGFVRGQDSQEAGGAGSDYAVQDLVVALRARGVNTSAVDRTSAVLEFDDRGVTGALRISPHYYNTYEELDAFLVELRRLVS